MNKLNKTPQEVFDFVVEKLRSQGSQSLMPNGKHCAYRGSDGMKCAAGWLIPDELYQQWMETQGVHDIELNEFFGELRPLINCLQTVHDGPVCNWEDGFAKIARMFNLIYTPPTCE